MRLRRSMSGERHGNAIPSFEEMFTINFANEDIEALREALSDMQSVVKVEAYLSKDESCYTCFQTLKLLKILRELSPSLNGRKAIELEIYYVEEHKDVFLKRGIYRVPTIRLLNGYITYLGMPAGEEIKAFIETLIRLSNGDHGLSSRALKALQDLEHDILLEVIVTPICPYCPYAALLANMVAYASTIYGTSSIRSVVIEAYENPDIADKYGITVVPTIVINGHVAFMGYPPNEMQLIDAILRYAKRQNKADVEIEL